MINKCVHEYCDLLCILYIIHHFTGCVQHGSDNNNNNNNNNFIYTVNYPISNTAGINGRTVFMNILTGIYSHYATDLIRITDYTNTIY